MADSAGCGTVLASSTAAGDSAGFVVVKGVGAVFGGSSAAAECLLVVVPRLLGLVANHCPAEQHSGGQRWAGLMTHTQSSCPATLYMCSGVSAAVRL